MRQRLIREKKLAPKLEGYFKRCISLALGDAFLKEFRRAKNPKKKGSIAVRPT